MASLPQVSKNCLIISAVIGVSSFVLIIGLAVGLGGSSSTDAGTYNGPPLAPRYLPATDHFAEEFVAEAATPTLEGAKSLKVFFDELELLASNAHSRRRRSVDSKTQGILDSADSAIKSALQPFRTQLPQILPQKLSQRQTETNAHAELSVKTNTKVEQFESCFGSAEIAFVLDHSGSMGGEPWSSTVDWFGKLVSAYQIDGTDNRGGIVVWSDEVDTSATVTFDQALTESQMKNKIENFRDADGGGTMGGKALDYTFRTLFNSGVKVEENIYQAVVFLSDGESSDDLIGPAQKFHDANIKLKVVALGDFDKTALQGMICQQCIGDKLYEGDAAKLKSDEFVDEMKNCADFDAEGATSEEDKQTKFEELEKDAQLLQKQVDQMNKNLQEAAQVIAKVGNMATLIQQFIVALEEMKSMNGKLEISNKANQILLDKVNVKQELTDINSKLTQMMANDGKDPNNIDALNDLKKVINEM